MLYKRVEVDFAIKTLPVHLNPLIVANSGGQGLPVPNMSVKIKAILVTGFVHIPVLVVSTGTGTKCRTETTGGSYFVFIYSIIKHDSCISTYQIYFFNSLSARILK